MAQSHGHSRSVTPFVLAKRAVSFFFFPSSQQASSKDHRHLVTEVYSGRRTRLDPNPEDRSRFHLQGYVNEICHAQKTDSHREIIYHRSLPSLTAVHREHCFYILTVNEPPFNTRYVLQQSD